MRLMIFFGLCTLVIVKAFRSGPIYLVQLLTFMYFVYPEKYIWGIENYRMVLVLNLVLIFITWYHHGRIDIFSDIFSKLILLLLFSFFISSQFALVSTAYAMEKTQLFLKLTIYFLTLKTLLSDARTVRLFYQGCLFSITLLAAWGIQQYALGNVRLEGFGGGQLLGSNQLASGLVWALPIGYFFMELTQGGWKKYLYLFSSGIIFVGIICTESRQAFLAILLYGVYIFMTSKRKVYFSVVLLLTLSLGIGFVPDSYWDRMKTIQNYEEDASATGRLEIWTQAVELWKENPFFGIGPGNFKKISPEYLGQERVTHNTYFQILSEQGLFGFIMFYLIMSLTIISLGRLVKLFRYHDQASEIYSYASMARMGLLGVLICCLFQNKANHEFLYFSCAVAASLNRIKYQYQLTG